MKKKPLVAPAEDLAGVNNQLRMLKKAFDVIYINAPSIPETDDAQDSLQRQVKCCFAKINENTMLIKQVEKNMNLMHKYAQEIIDNILQLGQLYDETRHIPIDGK